MEIENCGFQLHCYLLHRVSTDKNELIHIMASELEVYTKPFMLLTFDVREKFIICGYVRNQMWGLRGA